MGKIKNLILKSKSTINKIILGVVVTTSVIVSFYIGRSFENYKRAGDISVEETVTKIRKSDVNIAIDESNNLIIFDNQSDDYKIYEDSIGHKIFKLYARSIWTQHAPN